MLQETLQKAQTPSQVLCLLVAVTGYNLMPHVVFDKHGDLKPFASLYDLARKEVQQVQKSFLLDTALEVAMATKWTDKEPSPRSDDENWFVAKYGFKPSTTKQVRVFLLAQNHPNLHFYIDSKCEVWADLAKLLACMRAYDT
jgi:hypothetical protein